MQGAQPRLRVRRVTHGQSQAGDRAEGHGSPARPGLPGHPSSQAPRGISLLPEAKCLSDAPSPSKEQSHQWATKRTDTLSRGNSEVSLDTDGVPSLL